MSGFLYFFYKSAALFLTSFVAGTLIDIDHVFDYYIQEGVTFKIKTIYAWNKKSEYKYLFLYFHSVELLIMLWAGIFLFRLSIFWVVLTIGLTQHILLDIFFNPIHSYAYFLSYRIMKGFKKEYILKNEFLKAGSLKNR